MSLMAPLNFTQTPSSGLDEEIPQLVWPTLWLFAASLAAWIASTSLGLAGVWPWPLTMLLNGIIGYVIFTVSHEATHHALGTSLALNEWLGRLVNLLFAPHISFRMWRFMHMQHHRYTNQDGRDPDYYSSTGPGWLLPLRWATGDFNYLRIYLPLFRTRPQAERIELIVTWLAIAALLALCLFTGYGFEVLAFWILPCRIALFLLGWTFDYLPHYGLEPPPDGDRFKTTRNRVGAERLLTLLLAYQNYHLLHHLRPKIPFFNYIKAWRRHEEEFLSHEPMLVDVWGRPLSVDEYRRMRGQGQV